MIWLCFVILATADLWGQETQKLCQQCHSETAADVERHPHFAKKIGCDSCHGASEKHRLASGNVAPDRVATREQVVGLCGTCHVAERKSYETSRHWAVLQSGQKSAQCATCHGNHAPRAVAAMAATCQRCHTALPAACSGTPRVEAAKAEARLRCAGCHPAHGFLKK